MLNINPNCHNSIPTFKGQRDYSAIYKQMEKISLSAEDRIMPKESKKLFKNISMPKINFKQKISEFLNVPLISDETRALLCALFMLLSPVFILVAAVMSSIPQKEETKRTKPTTELTIEQKADSLINLYNNKKINLNEFSEQINKLTKN